MTERSCNPVGKVLRNFTACLMLQTDCKELSWNQKRLMWEEIANKSKCASDIKISCKVYLESFKTMKASRSNWFSTKMGRQNQVAGEAIYGCKSLYLVPTLLKRSKIWKNMWTLKNWSSKIIKKQISASNKNGWTSGSSREENREQQNTLTKRSYDCRYAYVKYRSD